MKQHRNVFERLAASRTLVMEVTAILLFAITAAKALFYQANPVLKSIFDYSSALSR